MKRTVRTVLSVLLFGALTLSLGSCRFLGFINPGWALEGSWEYVSKSWDGPEAYWVVLPGADAYQVLDVDRNVISSGLIRNLTDLSFEQTIDEHFIPEIIGGSNYQEYTLESDLLRATVYSDTGKTTNFGTYSAQRE